MIRTSREIQQRPLPDPHELWSGFCCCVSSPSRLAALQQHYLLSETAGDCLHLQLIPSVRGSTQSSAQVPAPSEKSLLILSELLSAPSSTDCTLLCTMFTSSYNCWLICFLNYNTTDLIAQIKWKALKPTYLMLWRYGKESLNPGSEAEMCHLLFQLCRAARPLTWHMHRADLSPGWLCFGCSCTEPVSEIPCWQ